MACILALDQGTTSSRAMLVDETGRVAGVASCEFPQLYPRPGWVEHDPWAIWESQTAAIRKVRGETGASLADVAAIGLTNQRETTLLWRRSDGKPLHNAIVWQDRRTAERCEALRAEGREEWIREKTGLVLDPYFSATKLEWLLDQVAGARSEAEAGRLAFGTVDTWLLWHLTGGRAHRTDRTNASRTMVWNLAGERWDPELLELFRIPASVLPEVLPSAALFGEGPVGLTGTERPIRITGAAGDQQAALFGQAGWSAGTAKNTYGTGCFLLQNAGTVPPRPDRGLLATAACGGDGGRAYAVEGSVFVAGAAVQWLRDGLGLIRHAAETEALARSVPDSAGVYFVPAFTGLGAPYWDSRARGAIVGLTRGVTRAHIARATLEAIALQTCDLIDLIARTSGRPGSLRVDGGATANDFLMQIQADLLGIPVERAAVQESTALGAAFLAGLGAGLWRLEDLETLWKPDRVFEPSVAEDYREAMRAGWRNAVARVMDRPEAETAKSTIS